MLFVSKVTSNTAYTATDLKHLHHSLIKCLSTRINKQYKKSEICKNRSFQLCAHAPNCEHMNDATVLEISIDIHEPQHIHQPTMPATLLTHTKTHFYTQQVGHSQASSTTNSSQKSNTKLVYFTRKNDLPKVTTQNDQTCEQKTRQLSDQTCEQKTRQLSESWCSVPRHIHK